MKPLIFFISEQDGKIRFEKEEIENLLMKAYDSGYEDGYKANQNSKPILPPLQSPYTSPTLPQYPYTTPTVTYVDSVTQHGVTPASNSISDWSNLEGKSNEKENSQ